MFAKTLKLHAIILCRILWDMGLLRLLFVFALTAFLAIYLFIAAQPFYFPALLAAILYCIHSCRNDKPLLALLFEKRVISFYWLEYAVIAAPFLVLSAVEGYVVDFACYIPLVLLIPIPILQTVRFKSFYLGNRFFCKGSYEYQTQFRRTYPFVFASYSLAFIGLAVDNDALFCFAYILSGLPFAIRMLKCESQIYVTNYMSIRYLFLHKFKSILYNNINLYIPLGLAAMLINCGLWSNMLLMFAVITMLIYASCLLRYVFPSTFIAEILFFVLLLPIFATPLLHPLCLFLPALTLLLIALGTYNKLKHLFYYAEYK
ncbi:MAG: hypothetical protein LBS05_07755 [Tannerellaceae bacterium]|jgi:hypothetical protein|nr:hypothetical protein [Tannerellaceae bacterium]